AMPVVQNVAARIEADAAAIRQALVEQLYRPVLWVQCMEALAGLGVTRALECGPGKVLCGLNKRIVKDMDCAALESVDGMAAALAG
ncbi:MAG: [acyl-carrier-protein] S-malonyltransferase, partial [Moraxellaceae bacterium]